MSRSAIVFSALGALFSVAAPQAINIKFTDAFPGTKFDRPVYFGPFPGMAGANVILEEHTANAIIVHRSPSGELVKDTLCHLTVGQDLEQGLLGIAFHPDFKTNRKYYISYTPKGTPYHDVVEERIADSTGLKDSGTPGRKLINLDDPYVNHNGGNIAFGPKDGYLYYAVGDGGGGQDPLGNGQDVNGWFSRMYRIDVNAKDPGLEYKIPADNPFAQGGGRPETFAYGLRNPWRWSFDPVTGDLWEGDVGEARLEEVNILTKGGNYGWSKMEGNLGTNDGNMLLPIFTFDHANINVNPNGPAIIGGFVFRGNPASKYYGTYFMADFGTKRFWNLKRSASGEVKADSLSPTPVPVSAFGVDDVGRIYACGLGNGIIYLLDDPDLQPGGSPVLGRGSRAQRGRAFAASPGGRLEREAFSQSPILEVFGIAGDHVATLHRDASRLPAGLRVGLYYLKPSSDSQGRHLLVVR